MQSSDSKTIIERIQDVVRANSGRPLPVSSILRISVKVVFHDNDKDIRASHKIGGLSQSSARAKLRRIMKKTLIEQLRGAAVGVPSKDGHLKESLVVADFKEVEKGGSDFYAHSTFDLAVQARVVNMTVDALNAQWSDDISQPLGALGFARFGVKTASIQAMLFKPIVDEPPHVTIFHNSCLSTEEIGLKEPKEAEEKDDGDGENEEDEEGDEEYEDVGDHYPIIAAAHQPASASTVVVEQTRLLKPHEFVHSTPPHHHHHPFSSRAYTTTGNIPLGGQQEDRQGDTPRPIAVAAADPIWSEHESAPVVNGNGFGRGATKKPMREVSSNRARPIHPRALPQQMHVCSCHGTIVPINRADDEVLLLPAKIVKTKKQPTPPPPSSSE